MTYANLSWNRTFDNNKKYVWVTESGSNVCDVCKSLNGKVFSGNKIPPKPHPNCRCAIMEEPVYDNYREKLKEIKSTVENVVCAEVEKEISRRNDSTDPVIEKIIAKNRFNIRKEIEKNVIFKVENAVLEKAATSDLTNLNKLITETAKIFVPEETEKVLTLEKKKYEKEEKKKEVFGQIMTEREKAQAEKVESIVKNCEATVKKIVAEEVNKEISRKNHTKDLTALRIAARLRNDEKQEIGQSVIYKVENAIREEAEKSETPDVKTLQKLIRETAKQAAREEVARTFERELKKYQRSEKEKRIKKGVEEAIKKEVHGQVLTNLEKVDDERIDTIVKNCKFTVEKAVVNELKIEQAAFKKIKDPGFAKIIEKDSDNIKKEVARNAIFEIELVIREEAKKSKNLDVRTLQKLIDKTAEKAVIKEIQNIIEREENKYIAAEKARKREEAVREQTAKDVENAIKRDVYGRVISKLEKADEERAYAKLRKFRYTIEKTVAKEVETEVWVHQYFRIPKNKTNILEREIKRNVIYKVEAAVLEVIETSDEKTINKLIKQTAKNIVREEAERIVEREEKEEKKKVVYGHIITKADEEKIDSVLKNCRATIEKTVDDEFKKALFLNSQQDIFAFEIIEKLLPLKKEITSSIIEEVEYAVREETLKPEMPNVKTLTKLIEETAREVTREKIDKMYAVKRQQLYEMYSEAIIKFSQVTSEGIVEGVDIAKKELKWKNNPKKDIFINLADNCLDNYQRIRHKTASKVLKDLEVTCPPEVAGKNKELAKYLLWGGSKVYESPNAKKLTLIGIDDIDKDYLENVKVYNKIEDLKLPKLKKTIKSLIKEDNEFYKKYEMPAIENCKTYWFNEKHELAEIIANSQAVKNFIRENKKINPSDEKPAFIEFKNGIDTDLYYAIHNARITRFKVDNLYKVIRIRIEDLYDFDPRMTDYPNRLGVALQRNGNLKPYYLVIDVSVPF